MTTVTAHGEKTQESVNLLTASSDHELTLMNTATGEPRKFDPQAGKIGWAILWLLGVPLPVLLVIYLIWGR